MSALLFSLLAQQAGELHIPDQRLLLLLLAQALLLLHELGIDGLGAELQRAEQVLQLPEVEDVLGNIFLALALCNIHRIGRLVQRSSGEDTAFHAKKKPTTRGQDDPNDISDKGKQTGQIRRRTCLDTKPTKQSKRSSRPDKNVPDKSGEGSIPTDENPAPVPVGRDGPNDRLQQIKRTKRTRQAKRTPRPTKAQAPVKRHDTAPRPDAFSPTAGRTGRRILSPHKPESRNGRRLSRTVATSSAYKYPAPDINDIDSRRNAATNAAPQTTTKCGWPVRIHRDTGPVALCPKYGNRTVRYRIT